MKQKIVLFLIFVIFFMNAPPMGHALTQEEIDKLPHISAMQALYLFKQKKILLLDVHDNKKRADIIGAYYIPSKKIDKIKLKIPKNQLIGVFCD